MKKNRTRGELLDPDSGADIAARQRPLQFHAEVFVVAGDGLTEVIKPLLPAEIPVEYFTSPDAYREAVSGNVAVVFLSASLRESCLRELITETLSRNGDARFGLLATDGTQLLQSDVLEDAGFVFPQDTEKFKSLAKRLYIRAYYCVAIKRYYRIGLRIRNRELQLDSEPDDELKTLRKSRERIRRYLEQFRLYLGPEDFKAISTRTDRTDEFLDSRTVSQDPTQIGLPTSCPECDLDWTTWHGSKQGNGYERIGANTWRCTACGRVIGNGEPDNYRVT